MDNPIPPSTSAPVNGSGEGGPGSTSSPQKIPPKKKKFSWWRLVLKTLIGLVLGLVLLFAVLFVQFLVTKKSPWDFLPQNYQFYIQVQNLRTVVDQWLNLDAAQVVLRKTPDLEGFEKVLLDVKSLGLTKDPLIGELLKVEVHAAILEKGQPLLVLDLDWRSMAARWAPLVHGWFGLEDLTLEDFQGEKVFKYKTGKTSALYLLIKDNLALAAFDLDTLGQALNFKTKNLALSQKKKDAITERFAQSSGQDLRFMADPRVLVTQLITDAGSQIKFTQALEWKSEALLGMSLDNQRFNFQMETQVASAQPLFKKLLEHQSGPHSALKSLSEATFLLTSFNLGSFMDLGDAVSYFQGQDIRGLLKTADDFAKPLLGMDLQEFLFSWVGSEAGVAFIQGSQDPVLYLTIKDEGALTRSLEKLKSSLALTTDTSLVLDGVRVPRITIPGFLKGLLGIFGFDFETPFYITVDNVFYMSMNPEALAKLVNDQKAGKTLARSEAFQRLTQGVSLDPALMLYYDLDRAVPFFLKGRGMLPEILKMYNRGLAVLYNKSGDLKLQLLGHRMPRQGTALYPGFPITLETGLAGDVVFTQIPGQTEVRALYLTRDGVWESRSLSGGERVKVPAEPGTRVVDGLLGDDALAVSPQGTVFRLKKALEPVPGYPAFGPWTLDFLPAVLDGRLFGLNGEGSQISWMEGPGAFKPWGSPLEAPLKSAPDYRDGTFTYAPKSFDGQVYLTDREGLVKSGWPQTGGGISLTGPRLFPGPGGLSVAFLVQKGQLNLWDLEGKTRPGFPLDLPGPFSAPLGFAKDGNQTYLVTLNQQGTLSLIDGSGKILRQKDIGSRGEEGRVWAADQDQDGRDEIFVYGGKNTLDGFTLNLEKIPGFPLTGSQKPYFMDLNLDGTLEMLCGSYDGKIYGYTVRMK